MIQNYYQKFNSKSIFFDFVLTSAVPFISLFSIIFPQSNPFHEASAANLYIFVSVRHWPSEYIQSRILKL